MTTREERETLQRFTEQYSGELTDVAQAIEGVVIGESWGVSGYTTMMQADRLGEVLTLQPGTNLLDLGAGRGWPGLYLAASTGCRAVLTDIPLEGLRSAIGRVGREHLSDQVAVVAASARAVPFRAGAFDAVVHTDMLC